MEEDYSNYTIPELISVLKSTFRKDDFKKVEEILKLREEKANKEKEEDVQKIKGEKLKVEELGKVINDLEERLATRVDECDKLFVELEKKAKEGEYWKKLCHGVVIRVEKLENDYSDLWRVSSELAEKHKERSASLSDSSADDVVVQGKKDVRENGEGLRGKNGASSSSNEVFIEVEEDCDGITEHDTAGPPLVNSVSEPFVNVVEKEDLILKSKPGIDKDNCIEIDDSDDEIPEHTSKEKVSETFSDQDDEETGEPTRLSSTSNKKRAYKTVLSDSEDEDEYTTPIIKKKKPQEPDVGINSHKYSSSMKVADGRDRSANTSDSDHVDGIARLFRNIRGNLSTARQT